MALFKINKGLSQNLPSKKTEGYAYFTTDDGKMYIDTSSNTRVALNAEKADKLRHARNLKIGNAAKAFDGSKTVEWSLDEIGAYSKTSGEAVANKINNLKVDDKAPVNNNIILDHVSIDLSSSPTSSEAVLVNANLLNGKPSNYYFPDNGYKGWVLTKKEGEGAEWATCPQSDWNEINPDSGAYIKNRLNLVNGLAGGSIRSSNAKEESSEYKLGSDAISLGRSSYAQGIDALALGPDARADGECSSAIGRSSSARGDYSYAMGFAANSSGVGSCAQGYFVSAPGDYSYAGGVYNKGNSNYVWSFGNGTDYDHKSNIAHIHKDGTAWFQTDVKIGGDEDNGPFISLKGLSEQLASHTHTMSQITDLPAWTKSASKPSYTASEVGAAAKSHTHDTIQCYNNNTGPQTGRTNAFSGVYTYRTMSDQSTGMPTSYTATIGFGYGTGGSAEISANWNGVPALWVRSLRDCNDDWSDWKKIMTEGSNVWIQKARKTINIVPGNFGTNSQGFPQATVACTGLIANSTTQKVEVALQEDKIGTVLIAGAKVIQDNHITIVCLSQPTSSFSIEVLISEVV